MSELDNHIQEISSVVWHFVDEISERKMADELLGLHGVSDVAANAIKTPGYVGRNDYRRKIFMHLMDSIVLSQDSDKVASLTIDEVNERLYNPQRLFGVNTNSKEKRSSQWREESSLHNQRI